MFDAPLDAWYVWVGLAAVATTALGVAASMPAAPPPDAAGAATTVDGVAASDHAAVGEHPLSNADAVRVGRDTIALRGAGGTAHARLGYGPVTPVGSEESLVALLRGDSPQRVFESSEHFETTLRTARRAPPQWRRTDRLLVRRVSWEGTDVVLVG